jgi:RimJ/RimL family protein N-acetyltransferase
MVASLFDVQPTLVGDTIYLRPMQVNDADALYEVASDPLIWLQHPSPLRYRREVFDVQILQSGLASKSALVIVDLKTEQIIGSTRYYDVDPTSQEVAIGFTFLERKFWGGVVNKQIKQMMLKHAFKWARRVWFHVGINNIRSRKAMEKIGAHLSHIESRPVNGHLIDHCYYLIDASQENAS